MAWPRVQRLSPRLLAAALVFGLFVAFDIALFGWLIVRSLSQRELENILLETRAEAEGLASRIAGRAQEEGEDLYTAIALERETQTYIDSVLKQRDIVQTVEIRDKNGLLVFRSSAKATIPSPPAPAAAPERRGVPPQIEHKTFEHESTYDVTVPIGDLGMLRIGISRGELEERIGRLRSDLLRETLLIGAVTLGLLVTAYLAIWWLWRRGRRLEEQAREAERMAYVGTLASGLAHEIRNPLNSLSLNMQMLEEQEERQAASPAGARRTLLALTRGEIHRLERLVGDFLAYARPRPLELEEVPAGRLLHHARELLQAEARAASAELAIEDRCGGAEVRVDRAQIGQLLVNLAQNALAATEGSGRPRRVGLACRRDGSHVVLEVSDNGVGIPESEREKIFDLFYSTRKGGTGLGLAIVRRIAQAHQGTIEVRSAPGVGTTIAVALPAAGPPREARVARSAAEGVAS